MTTNESARQHWDARHADATLRSEPLELLASTTPPVSPGSPRTALDVAGGTGADARWLATQGYTVSLADVSPVALDRAVTTAEAGGLTIEPLELDLETGSLPDRAWDVIHVANFLNRALLASIGSFLNPGGIIMIVIATTTNLERNEHPRASFLVSPAELADIIGPAASGLMVDHHDAAWRANGRHEAWLTAHKPS